MIFLWCAHDIPFIGVTGPNIFVVISSVHPHCQSFSGVVSTLSQNQLLSECMITVKLPKAHYTVSISLSGIWL